MMSTPKVSIIILNWNKLEYLRNCVSSIEKNTRYPNYEVVVFDNGSKEPGTKEYLGSLKRHKAVSNPDNIGFARGNNEAVKSSAGEFVLFLNNDTVVHDNWLEPMVKLMLKDPSCGAVGSKLLYPDGTIQHIGVMFDYRGNSRHIFKKYPPHIPQALETVEREAVTGACLLMRRDVFDRVGGFDGRFRQGSEDIDLCLKIRELGLKIMYCPESVLTHFEGVTMDTMGKGFKKKSTRKNLELFRKKWGAKLDGFRLSNDLDGLKPYQYYQGSRDCIARLVPPSSRFILDVGCAGGMLGKSLKDSKPGIKVWGIEINESIAKEAEKNIDRVFVVDIEKAENIFGEDVRFDCIIFADVLEHLRDPWKVLKKFHRHLAPNGRIICSIPNIRHYKIVKDIVRDRWLYRDQGVLDIDHIRFFSLATIKNMLAVSGYEVERLESNQKASGAMRLANTLLFNRLENFLVQQYLAVCRRRGDN